MIGSSTSIQTSVNSSHSSQTRGQNDFFAFDLIPEDAPKEFKDSIYKAIKAIEDEQGAEIAQKTLILLSAQFNIKERMDNHGVNAKKFEYSYEDIKKFVDLINDLKYSQIDDPLKKSFNTLLNVFEDEIGNNKNEVQTYSSKSEVKSYGDDGSNALKALLNDLFEKGALKFLQIVMSQSELENQEEKPSLYTLQSLLQIRNSKDER